MMSTDGVQRSEMAGFLRARRAAVGPDRVGLPAGGRRRTPGLRREEVALLAGVSVTWYTWLEQARPMAVSRPVLDSLARVLLLTPTERAHLFRLAGLDLPADPGPTRPVDPTLLQLVDVLQPHPAYVINPWWDVLAHNAAYDDLIGGLGQRPRAERNTLWLTFADRAMRHLLVDWHGETRQLVGQLRDHLARHPDDPRGHALIDDLSAASSDFANLWPLQHVARFEPKRKRFDHPRRGRVDYDYTKLATIDTDHDLVVFLPPQDRGRSVQDPASGGTHVVP